MVFPTKSSYVGRTTMRATVISFCYVVSDSEENENVGSERGGPTGNDNIMYIYIEKSKLYIEPLVLVSLNKIRECECYIGNTCMPNNG